MWSDARIALQVGRAVVGAHAYVLRAARLTAKTVGREVVAGKHWRASVVAASVHLQRATLRLQQLLLMRGSSGARQLRCLQSATWVLTAKKKRLHLLNIDKMKNKNKHLPVALTSTLFMVRV